MLETYFDKYYVSEQELKERVYFTLERLTCLAPHYWQRSSLEAADPGRNTNEILLDLINQYSELALLNCGASDTEVLRLLAITLDVVLEKEVLNGILVEHIYKSGSDSFLGFRYVFVTQIMEEKLGLKLRYDQNTIQSILAKPAISSEDVQNKLFACNAAKEEIERFTQLEDSEGFRSTVKEFELSVHNFIRDNCYSACRDAMAQLLVSATLKHTPILEQLEFDEKFTESDKKEWFEDISKLTKQISKTRLGLLDGRGGSRKRTGFVWTDENKLIFYEQVAKQPRIGKLLMWDYAFRELNEKDFHWKFVDYLKNETVFEEVPDSLFQEAIRIWKGYKDIFPNPKTEEKPKAFALRHALDSLDFPYTKYSTINKYYGEGKKLYESNNLVKENSKS